MKTEYNEFNKDFKEIKYIVNKFFWWIVGLILLITAIGFITDGFGLLGKTVLERAVFEQSFQRKAGLEAQLSAYEASLREIELKLRNPNLDKNTRYNLEAQASTLRARINSVENIK